MEVRTFHFLDIGRIRAEESLEFTRSGFGSDRKQCRQHIAVGVFAHIGKITDVQ